MAGRRARRIQDSKAPSVGVVDVVGVVGVVDVVDVVDVVVACCPPIVQRRAAGAKT